MPGLWFEITARTPPGLVDVVSAAMRDVSPGGITVEESIDILGPEMGFRVRTGEDVLVRAYLPASELGAVLTDRLRKAMEAFPAVELIAKPIYEQDWSVSWREFFGVVETGGRVVIVPTWIEHEAQPGQVVVTLDPGQAFGTGHHETTRLCLLALDRLVTPGVRMLDVGTGSGVLAIAAVGLGAGHVDGVDIDPIAVDVARANCEANGVAGSVSLRAGTVEEDEPGRYGLVVANISTAANIGMAPVFGKVAEAGATVLLSGILTEDAERVCEAMAAHGLARARVEEDGDWCLIELRHE